MSSRFLPSGWSTSDRIALLSGQGGIGSYPWQLWHNAQSSGFALPIVSMRGETSAELSSAASAYFAKKDPAFPSSGVIQANVGDLGALIKALKTFGARGLVMAGQVTPGRILKDVFPDLRAMTLILSLKEKNAETIFGAVSAEIEKEGIKVLDARSFMDAEMASNDVMIQGSERVKPEAIEHAIKVAEAMAQNDVGQCVVTRRGTVLAVEAFEGTDAMIERAATFKTEEKIFVKTVKRNQDYRFDVPIFGLKTLENLAKASIKTAVLKSDGVIIPQKAEVIERSKQYKISILGY
jgi:DUF1009 family protein